MRSLEQIVELGLVNTLEIDLIWSAHHQISHKYDFKQGSRDLEQFLQLTARFGLYVIVRLDPYHSCGEYDLGGLPAWILAQSNEFVLIDDDVRVLRRSLLHNAFRLYLDQVLPILSKYQVANGGPVIAFVSRFYNPGELRVVDIHSFNSLYDREYIKFLHDQFYRHGIVELLLTSISVCDLDREIDRFAFKTYCDPSLFVYLPIDDDNNRFVNFYDDVSDICFDDDFSKYLRATSNRTVIDRFFQDQENNLLKFKYNALSLIRSSKSFVIENFFYVSDREMERGAHQMRASGEYVPLSASEFGVELKYMVNGDTARVTRKYAILSSLLKNMPGDGNVNEGMDAYSDTRRSYMGGRSKLDDEKRREMPRIRMSHFMHYDRILMGLFDEIQVKIGEEDLSMENLNEKFRRESSNKGYVLYRLKVYNLTFSYF